MSAAETPRQEFHLHLVSDSTGETLNALAKAVCSQFETVNAREHFYALVRSPKQLERTLEEIAERPGIVFFTIAKQELRDTLEQRLQDLNIPFVSVLDDLLRIMVNFLGVESGHKIGSQHAMDDEYFGRIEALNFTMAHDDGQMTESLNDADVVLIGVSRTSKTPTCIYLANRGVKTANVPMVPECPLPVELDSLTNPLVVGLVVSPPRLMAIRRNRLLSLNQSDETSYIDIDAIREELTAARRLFDAKGWHTIDVTRKSIEETAAGILNLLQHRNDL